MFHSPNAIKNLLESTLADKFLRKDVRYLGQIHLSFKKREVATYEIPTTRIPSSAATFKSFGPSVIGSQPNFMLRGHLAWVSSVAIRRIILQESIMGSISISMFAVQIFFTLNSHSLLKQLSPFFVAFQQPKTPYNKSVPLKKSKIVGYDVWEGAP